MPSTALSDSGWMEKFSRFLSLYQDDLPEERFLSMKLKSWESYWEIFREMFQLLWNFFFHVLTEYPPAIFALLWEQQ